MYKESLNTPDTQTVKPLTDTQLREVNHNLPDPVQVLQFPFAQALTYIPKHLNSSVWTDDKLQLLAAEARKTYLRYGPEFGQLDKYEGKAVHFLTKVEYPHSNHPDVNVVEFHSLRFIPPYGDPPNTEDLDFYVCQPGNIPIFDALSSRLPTINGSRPEDVIITQSRLCVIRPFLAQDKSVIPPPSTNLHTALAFAINTKAVISYLVQLGYPSEKMWMTSQMWRFLKENTVAYNGLTLPFFPASEVLSANGSPLRVMLDRSKAYAYKVPAYFLQWSELITTLKSLHQNGDLSLPDGYLQLPERLSLKKLDEDLNLRSTTIKLGQFLTKTGTLPNSNITGESLRNILDNKVPDQPSLWISRLDTLMEGCDTIILAAQAK